MAPLYTEVVTDVLPGQGAVGPAQQINQARIGSTTDAMTARAGGGQALATPITVKNARFTVVATANDSALLPPAQVGMEITVVNSSANSMNIFPSPGGSINALANDAAFALATLKSVIFKSFTAGKWITVPNVP